MPVDEIPVDEIPVDEIPVDDTELVIQLHKILPVELILLVPSVLSVEEEFTIVGVARIDSVLTPV